ncbi:hypothetical protein V8E52_011364 [Russula decolorans]
MDAGLRLIQQATRSALQARQQAARTALQARQQAVEAEKAGTEWIDPDVTPSSPGQANVGTVDVEPLSPSPPLTHPLPLPQPSLSDGTLDVEPLSPSPPLSVAAVLVTSGY